MLASDGERDEHDRFVRKQSLEAFPYVLSSELGMTYRIGKLPYAVLIDHEGVIRAKGLVNTREHLESLIEAMEMGIPSIQEFVRRQQHPHSDPLPELGKGTKPSEISATPKVPPQ